MMEVLTLPIWKTSTCLMLPLWRGSPALTCPRSVGSMSSAWRSPDAFVFPTRDGTRMSHDAVTARLALHTAAATAACPTLTGKTVTAHVLRHTAAMRLLTAGIDSTVIALWLGHESIETTQVYLHANIKTKEDALARTRPTGASPGRYTVTDDTLLAFLDGL